MGVASDRVTTQVGRPPIHNYLRFLVVLLLQAFTFAFVVLSFLRCIMLYRTTHTPNPIKRVDVKNEQACETGDLRKATGNVISASRSQRPCCISASTTMERAILQLFTDFLPTYPGPQWTVPVLELVRLNLTLRRGDSDLGRDLLAFVGLNLTLRRGNSDFGGDFLALVGLNLALRRGDGDLSGDLLALVGLNLALRRGDSDLSWDLLALVGLNLALRGGDSDLSWDLLAFVWLNLALRRGNSDLGRDILALDVGGDHFKGCGRAGCEPLQPKL
jgi:hypothetical protein